MKKEIQKKAEALKKAGTLKKQELLKKSEQERIYPEEYQMVPMDRIGKFRVRPGIYELEGATALPSGVNFTIQTREGTSVELLLFRNAEMEPYAVLPFPETYRIGSVWSMIVFGLDITEFEYAYRLDGPWEPKKGLLFDRRHVLLDIYAKAVTGQKVWGKKKAEEGAYPLRQSRSLILKLCDLLIQILTGAAVYISLSVLFKLEPYIYLKNLLKEKLLKKNIPAD